MKSNQRLKSPEFISSRSPTSKVKAIKTVEQILYELNSNDFINQMDLAELNLNNKQICDFFPQIKRLKQIKAIKLQKNNLTDFGL